MKGVITTIPLKDCGEDAAKTTSYYAMVQVESDLGFVIDFESMGYETMEGYPPIYVEVHNGIPRVLIWDDINCPDPTIISLHNAHYTQRVVEKEKTQTYPPADVLTRLERQIRQLCANDEVVFPLMASGITISVMVYWDPLAPDNTWDILKVDNEAGIDVVGNTLMVGSEFVSKCVEGYLNDANNWDEDFIELIEECEAYKALNKKLQAAIAEADKLEKQYADFSFNAYLERLLN